MPILHTRMPFLYTRIFILVVSIVSSAFVLASPVEADGVITPHYAGAHTVAGHTMRGR